jgi:hypothetical protein
MFERKKIRYGLLLISVLLGALSGHPAAGESGLSGILVEEQIAAVHYQAMRLPLALRQRFEERFAAWKKTWQDPQIAVSSNTKSVTHSKEFHELIALGKYTLPAIAEKLLDPDNFFALQLYDILQDDRNLVLSSPEDGFEGEQTRARKTIQLYANSLR